MGICGYLNQPHASSGIGILVNVVLMFKDTVFLFGCLQCSSKLQQCIHVVLDYRNLNISNFAGKTGCVGLTEFTSCSSGHLVLLNKNFFFFFGSHQKPWNHCSWYPTVSYTHTQCINKSFGSKFKLPSKSNHIQVLQCYNWHLSSSFLMWITASIVASFLSNLPTAARESF